MSQSLPTTAVPAEDSLEKGHMTFNGWISFDDLPDSDLKSQIKEITENRNDLVKQLMVQEYGVIFGPGVEVAIESYSDSASVTVSVTPTNSQSE